MAYNVSNEYKQVIYSGDARNKIKILFNNVELQEADRYCERATIKSRIIPNGAKRFSLNNFISKEVEIILHDIDTSIIQDKVSISIGTLVGNAYEYVPIGIFNIQGTPTTDKNKITIKLRDNSVKFDFNYNAKPLIDEEGGSATKLQILQDICSKASVTCNISSFIGSTDSIGIYDNTITARQYIADIAEQAGRIATINRSGELIFVNINSLTTWNIPLSIVEKYEIGKAYRIGKVVYEDAIRKYETASTNYDTLYLDASNPYISSQEQVNSILQQVNNFTIDSVKTGKILGNPAIDSYDLINVYNDKVEGNPSIFKTLATSDLVYNGVLISTYDTQIGEEERKENVSIVGEATFKKWATTNINNINGEIDIQAGKIDNIQKEINPTKDTSGSSIYLEDSTNAELVNFEMEGKTIQASEPSPSNPSELVSVGTYITETGKYGIEVVSQGANYFDASKITSSAITVEDNGKNIIMPIATSGNGLYGTGANLKDLAPNLRVGDTVYLYFDRNGQAYNRYIYLYGSEFLWIKGNARTITQQDLDGRVGLYANRYINGETEQITISNLRIVKVQNTGWEQFKSKTYLYTLNKPLRSIGDTKDLLYIKNGMLYVDRKISSVVLDGSESGWYIGNSGNTGNIKRFVLSLSASLPNQSYDLKSNYFVGGMPYSSNVEGVNINSSSLLSIYKDENDLASFKTWLSTHNTEVQYILAEPNTEGLGKIEVPITYKTITHINTTDDNEPNMNITYVRDTQLTNYVEEHISQIIVNEEGITQRVQTIEDSDYDSRLNAVEQKQTDTDLTIDIISTNIDKTNGNIQEVTTTTGFTFNAEGMTIEDSSSQFKAQHRVDGTYYKDGDTIVGQYTKDGSKQKDLALFGVYYYGMNDIDDTPMFVAQLYTDNNGEEGFGHFPNRSD